MCADAPSMSDVAAAKRAFASERGLEPCANDARECDACECGARCGCETAARDAKTCEPCVEFKARKLAATARRAR